MALVALCAAALWQSDTAAEWLANGNPACRAPSPKYDPVIVASGPDGAILAWTDDRTYGGASDIYAVRILLNGERDPRWPAAGLPVCTAPGTQMSPCIVSDGVDGAIVAWMDDRDGLWGVFAQRLTASGGLAPNWPLDGVRLCAGVGGLPVAVSDDESGVIVAWRDFQSNGNDVRVLRIDQTGGLASGWPQGGVIVASGSTLPNLIVSIAGDGNGGAVVTWNTLADSIDVFAQHVTATGSFAAGWPAAGVTMCSAPGGQFNPSAVTDALDGAFVAWADARSDNGDIYASHVLPDGHLDPVWPADGAAVCTEADGQVNPLIISDDGRGCIVVWQDFRSGASQDIYAQRIAPDGSPAVGWPESGVPLCVAGGHQFDHAVVSDGEGGLIASWQDARTDGGDIYAQRVTSSGSIPSGWAANGVRVAGAPNVQGDVALATDLQQGAMICWADRRSDQDDVYVQRVSALGAVGPDIPIDVPPNQLELRGPSPNPVREVASLTVRVPSTSLLTLTVVDVAGRLVATLEDRSPLSAGDHTITWDGRDDQGQPIPPGIYVLHARTQHFQASRKIVKL